MRAFLASLGLLIVVAGAIAVAVFPTWRTPSVLPPARLPHAWNAGAGAPTAWIFVRRGCPFCSVHLQALERCMQELPAAQRDTIRHRLRIVGPPPRALPGVAAWPEAWRESLGVHWTPTTWLVDADGAIREAWQGARNERAWNRALHFLAGSTGGS